MRQGRALLLRLVRITAGVVVLVAGTAMLVLPGPGILTILAGLAILARDVPWAERKLASIRSAWAARRHRSGRPVPDRDPT